MSEGLEGILIDRIKQKFQSASGQPSDSVSRSYDLKILFTLLPFIALLYWVRLCLALLEGEFRAGGILLVAGILFTSVRYIPKLLQTFHSAALWLVLTAVTIECSLVFVHYIHVTYYLLHVTVLIMVATLTSGFVSGCVIAAVSTSMAAWLLTTLPPERIANIHEDAFSRFSYGMLAHLLVAQAVGVLTILVVNKVLAKKEEEIHTSRIELAKYERRQHLSAQFGEIAHEMNNSLAVINGAFHLYKLYRNSGKTESSSQVLNQMVESEAKLQNFIEKVHELVNKETNRD